MTWIASRRDSMSTLLALGAVLTVVTLLVISCSVFLSERGTSGVRAELDGRAGADVALRASLDLGPSATKQDHEVRAAVAKTFAGTGVHFAVTRTLYAHVTVRPLKNGNEYDIDSGGAAISVPSFMSRATIVEGAYSTASNETLVQADAAKTLGLEPGDELLLAGVRFRIAGTWRANDLLDPRWYGDKMVASGVDGDYGPFVISEAAWGRIHDNPTAVWTLVPDTSEVDSTNLQPVITAWSRIADDWRGEVSETETLAVQSQFVQTLREIESRLEGLRAVEPIIYTLLVAVALVAASELVRLLGATRTRERALYWARGASGAEIARRSVLDVLVAGVAGVLLGAALATALAIATGTSGAVLQLSATVGIPSLLVIAGAVLLTVLDARRTGTDRRDRLTRRRSGRRLAIPGIVVLVALAAGLSVWQLRLYGSPLTPTANGTGGVDPVAVAAPAASVVALVLALLLLFPALASANEKRNTRGAFLPQLAARNLSRRLAAATAPLVLISLAAASVTIAASYSATWANAFTQTAELRAGSDIHASARLDGISQAAQDAVASAQHVKAVAPLEMQPFTIGGQSGTTLGVSPDALETLGTTIPGIFDPAAVADKLRIKVPGPVLPDGATGCALTVTAQGFDHPPSLSAFVVDRLGFLRSLPMKLETTGVADGELVYTIARLPSIGSGPWRIASLDFDFGDQQFQDKPASVQLTALTASVGGDARDVKLDGFWLPDIPWQTIEPPGAEPGGLGFRLTDATPQVRFTPSLSGTVEDNLKPPIVVSQSMADQFGIKVGDFVAFNLQDGMDRLNFSVAAIVPAVPTAPTEAGLLVDLAFVQHYQLRASATPAQPRDLWIASAHPESAVSAVRSALPANTRIETRADEASRQVLGAASVALWGAAIGIVILAVIGVASAARARLRAGRNDFAVLRAIGLRPGEQAGLIVRELLTVQAVAVLAGLAIGIIASRLTIPFFARAAVPHPYFAIATPLSVDVLALGAAVLLLLAGLAVVLLTARRAIARDVETAVPSEGSD